MILTQHGINSSSKAKQKLFRFALLSEIEEYSGTVPETVKLNNENWSKIPGGSSFKFYAKFNNLCPGKDIYRVKFDRYTYNYSGVGANHLRLPFGNTYAFRYHHQMGKDKNNCLYCYDVGSNNIPSNMIYSGSSEYWIYSNDSKFNNKITTEYIRDGKVLYININNSPLYRLEFNSEIRNFSNEIRFENEVNTNGYLIRNLEIEFA